MIRFLVVGLLTAFAVAFDATAADIPPLTGTTEVHFIAAWWNSDGATVTGGTTEFAGLFGPSTRDLESETTAQAPFAYNVTNFRVSASLANCGGLTAGQSFTFALRKNGVDTALTGTCIFGAAANSFTLDTDIVSVEPGDRLAIRVTQVGAILNVNLRTAVAMEGIVIANTTTEPVIDMTNELMDTVTAFLPIWLGLVLLIAFSIKENYAMLGISGVCFLVGSALSPMGYVMRIVIGAFGFIIIFYVMMHGKDWNDQRKANNKSKE